jgi:hypothetical protein
MYGAAGAAEEALSPVGGGVEAVPGRVAREVFSGLPGVHGEKRDFIEVMERGGVPELGHLSDVVGPFTPVLGGVIGPGKLDPTGRGMLGFAADIALDPTTYITSGGSTVGRFATSKGVLNLSKKGLVAKDAIVKDLSLTSKMLDESADATLREMGRRQVREVLELRVADAVKADPSLLEKTGLKFAGFEVVSPRLMKNLTEPVKKMILSAPLGQKSALFAEAWGDGLRKAFDAYADLSKLDDTAREGMKNEVRQYQSAVAANMHRESQAWAEIQKDEARLARKYGKGDAGVQALGKKFADWRQGTGVPSLTGEEEELFNRVASNYDIRGETNVRNGVISGEQYDKYKGKYLHQDYKNKEDLSEEMVRQAVADGLLPAARVNKERQFDTFADAVSVSKALEREGKLARERGVVRPMYRELVPEYSISKNLWSHMEQSNRAVFQKKLFEDISEKYGAKIDEFYDPSRVYSLREPIQVNEKDRAVIEEFVQDHRSLKDLSESFDFQRVTAKTPELRLANTRLNAVLASAPVKYVERQRLKNLDEFRYYKRRGWEIAEEGDNKYVAYKPKEVGTAEYTSWYSKVKKAKAEVEAAAERAGRDVRVGREGWDNLATEARKVLPTMSGDGQREFARQLTSMAKDESHVLRVREAVGDSLMPNVKAVKAGDINPFFLKHGLPEEKSKLVTRGGGVWGDQPHLIPQAIADLMDDAPRDLLADKLLRKNVGGLVKFWDKTGNFFKGITYPFYPMGGFRDLYNNLENGFLALGIGSLTRPDIAERIVWADKIGGDKIVELGKHRKTAQQWKRAFEAVRITDPSASSFVQTTGKAGAQKATLYAKARAFRGQVDNTTRTQLAAAGMRMGMELEDAARMVHEFQYNYAELSPFDRDIMRRAMPFYVFPRKTIGLYPRVAVKTPGRLANLHKPFQGRDDENQEMTSWEGEGYKVRLDKNGKDLTVLNGVDLPVRSFDMLYSGGWTKTLERLVGSAHPIPKVAYMLASGRDPFRGREMTRTSAPSAGRLLEDAPAWLKEWTGWRKKLDAAGRPTYTVNEAKLRDTLEITMTSRIFSTSDAYFRDQLQEPGAPNWWLRVFTGLQLKKLNMDEEKRKQFEAKKKIAEDEAVKQGDAYRFQKVLPTGR